MSPRPSRRSFLAGAGVTLALPFLPSALWSRRAGAAVCTPPRRFMAWFAPNGMVMNNWTPPTTGTGWASSPILAPLAPIQNKLLVLTGLDHQDIAVPPPPAPVVTDNYTAGTGCFLNMIPVSGYGTDPTRTSLDQALLPVLNDPACGTTLLPTGLQIGMSGPNGLCALVNCNFSRMISWNRGVAMPCTGDPASLFLEMFGGPPQTSQWRTSILDSVVAQAKSLSITLSPTDRLKLDQHLTSVRNVETRLERIGKTNANNAIGMSCTPPSSPTAPYGSTASAAFASEFDLFVELMALAFECDITRSITFMIGGAHSQNDYAFLVGSPATQYTLIQAEEDAGPASLAQLTEIDTYQMQQAARLLARLDGVIEADGQSILDHTTFYMSCDVADGPTGNHWDMPVVLAGGASGALKIDGRHINYTPSLTLPRTVEVGPRNPNQNTGQVFISILQAHGIMQNTFGLATGGPLSELTP
jgi:uncharacterized protein DUF1552